MRAAWYEAENLSVGTHVAHPSRGGGVVVALDSDSQRVHVKFDQVEHGMHRYRQASWVKKFKAVAPRREKVQVWEEESRFASLRELCTRGVDAMGAERLALALPGDTPAERRCDDGTTLLMLCCRRGAAMAQPALAMVRRASAAALRTPCVAPSRYAGADALWWACRARPPSPAGRALIALLLERGATVSAVAALDGTTALWHACTNGMAHAAAALVKRGADVNVSERESGRSALYAAVAVGDEATARMLIACGADIDALDVHGTNALWRACYAKRGALALFLVKSGADVHSTSILKGWDCLLCACSAGLIQVAHALLEAGASASAADARDGTNALFWCCRKGHNAPGLSIIALALIARGADVTPLAAKDGTSALYWAVKNQLSRVAMELVARGAPCVGCHRPSGRSALWWAQRHGFLALAKALVDGGAEVNRCENGRFGWDSPATIAAAHGHAANVTLLLNSGADASYRSAQSGNTAGEMVRRLSQADLRRAEAAVRELTVLQEEEEDGAPPLPAGMAQWFNVDGIEMGHVVEHPLRGRGRVVLLEEAGIDGAAEARVHIQFDDAAHGMHRYRKASWAKKIQVLLPRGGGGGAGGVTLADLEEHTYSASAMAPAMAPPALAPPALARLKKVTKEGGTQSKKKKKKTKKEKASGTLSPSSSSSSSSPSSSMAAMDSYTSRMAKFALAARKVPPSLNLEDSCDRSLGRRLLTAHFGAAIDGERAAQHGAQAATLSSVAKLPRSRSAGRRGRSSHSSSPRSASPPPRPAAALKPRLRSTLERAGARVADGCGAAPQQLDLAMPSAAAGGLAAAAFAEAAAVQNSVTIAAMSRRKEARQHAAHVLHRGDALVTFPQRVTQASGGQFAPFRDIAVLASAPNAAVDFAARSTLSELDVRSRAIEAAIEANDARALATAEKADAAIAAIEEATVGWLATVRVCMRGLPAACPRRRTSPARPLTPPPAPSVLYLLPPPVCLPSPPSRSPLQLASQRALLERRRELCVATIASVRACENAAAVAELARSASASFDRLASPTLAASGADVVIHLREQ